MSNVAFIGTGLLGGALAEGMLRRGEAVTVWNRTEAKARALQPFGATVAATPAAAVEGADYIHFTLVDDAVVDAILSSIRSSLRPGAIVIDHTTTAPLETRRRVDRLRDA